VTGFLFRNPLGNTVVNLLSLLDEFFEGAGPGFGMRESVLDVLSESIVELVVERLVVPGNECLEALEFGCVGGNRGCLAEGSQFAGFSPDKVGVSKHSRERGGEGFE
jgi:hypothetical protein